MNSTNLSLSDLLLVAQRKISIIGVVPLTFDWQTLCTSWAARLQTDHGLNITVLCESDNMLFERAFLTDTEYVPSRRSYRELKFARDDAMHVLQSTFPDMSQDTTLPHSSVSIEIIHLRIPIPAMQIDERIFVDCSNEWTQEGYREVSQASPEFRAFRNYIESLTHPKMGRKYSARPEDEVLELYDHERIPRGIFPRSSFYDTDFSQLVIWGLVFDRRGRILIHRRSDNAKDNRSMWDKSVGGHVDFALDVDTSRAMSRELVEELFTDEIKRHAEINVFEVNDEDLLFLGDWRPDRRRRAPFREIAQYDREWTFFRLRTSEQVYSPRTLPNGNVRRLRVIADIFLFVAGPSLNHEGLGTLQNSTFKLLELAELKTAMDRALRGEQVADFETQNLIPQFSPDLVNIMTGALRDQLEDFSQHIKRFLLRRQ